MQRFCDSGSGGTERIMITTTILNPLRARWTSMRRCYAPLTYITKAVILIVSRAVRAGRGVTTVACATYPLRIGTGLVPLPPTLLRTFNTWYPLYPPRLCRQCQSAVNSTALSAFVRRPSRSYPANANVRPAVCGGEGIKSDKPSDPKTGLCSMGLPPAGLDWRQRS